MIALALLARAEYAWLLLAPPLAWVILRARERVRARRVREIAGARHAALVPPEAARPRGLRPAAFAGGLLLATAAALHPAWGEAAESVEQRGVDVVVCLDVSRSMLARDVAPDRLSRAKAEVRALCKRARGDGLALVVFAGEARLLVPRTRDLGSLADLADAADPSSVARGGTDLAAALAAAGAALEGADGAHEAVLLLTDGEDLGGRGEREAEALAARGIAVHCVGFGTRLGAKIPVEGERGPGFVADPAGGEVVSALDAAGLARIAAATGGAYVDGSASGHPLVALYEKRILPMAQKAFAGATRRGAPDHYQGPLAAALLLFALDLSLSKRRRR